MNSSERFKPYHLPIFGSLLTIFIFFYVLEYFSHGVLRHLKYLLPFIALMLFLTPNTFASAYSTYYRNYFKRYLFLYVSLIFLSLITILFRQELYLRYFKELYFIVAPIVFALIAFLYFQPVKCDLYAKYTLIGVSLAYIIQSNVSIISSILDLRNIFSWFITSTVYAESAISSVFGIFFLYFFIRKKKIWAFVSAILVLASFKRSAILASIVGLVAYYLFRVLRINIAKRSVFFPAVMVMGNFLLVLILYRIGVGYYDEIIQQYTGMAPNSFMMGRRDLYSFLFSEIPQIPWFGVGLGQIAHTLIIHDMPLQHTHSDVLKYFLEFGPIIFMVWIYYLYKINTISSNMIVLTVYLNVLLLTENVSVYVNIMFIYYMLQGFLLLEDYDSVRITYKRKGMPKITPNNKC